jgi:MFS family permease
MFRAGVALFTLASMLAGFAPSSPWLLLARAMQGLAAALATPSTLALLSVSFAEAGEQSATSRGFSKGWHYEFF